MGKKHNILRNTKTFLDTYYKLKNIALSVFEWENLPETCSARFLEKTLFENGRAIFVNDREMSFLNLRVAPFDTVNVYEECTKYTAFSVGYSKDFSDGKDCVYIRNNYCETATDEIIRMYAERIANIQLTIDLNLNAHKTPVLIRTDEKSKLTLENLYTQYNNNKPVIVVTNSLSEKPIEVINTDAPYIIDKLREEMRSTWYEALEFLGINTNPSYKKKERLIDAEVKSNNEEVIIQSDVMLLCREDACRKINDLFGLDVSVKRRVETVEGGVETWQNSLYSSEPSSKMA